MTPRTLFRTAAIAEAVTWTMLLAGILLRATLGLDLAVTIGGGVHGFVFLAYAAAAVLVAINQRWSPGLSILAVAAAVVPYATVPLELWAARTGRLDGPWRREATDDPRDSRWYDRIARWLFRHPVPTAAALAVAVAVAFTVLLILGPPPLPGS